ncbi:MarR family winged helix-turn-helix transcriptional regulator [Micromonospora carbonacea]|uniref:MarR family transcriptional regulator n=1 Tax=Micromonospora carbonacea TaxID=47853 RepID=A0A7H8XK43_9ACTN|nr:helix-turn-helix domain-containing protein [Micromonospora carbonacea]MBB5825842.1 DNA-binding MarR family transcriptional regulator [Micromonospora carbonacea]QLD25443.1 MarR family transcriptional regulator [Micromonospora carbonacea]
MTDLLTADELRRWELWKRATDEVWAGVGQEIADATGLSTADFAVLTRTVEAAVPPRQQALADQLGWSRSRLSRQLSRMAERGLVIRTATPTSSTVEATDRGRAAAASARRAHAAAVRAVLLARAPSDGQFWHEIERLAGARPGSEQPS